MNKVICTCPACLETASFFQAMTIAEDTDLVPQWVEHIIAKYAVVELPVCHYEITGEMDTNYDREGNGWVAVE